MSTQPHFIDLAGLRSGRLLVIERAEDGYGKQPRWRCVCDCGTERIVYGAPLRAGIWPEKYSPKINSSKSCGCLHHELARLELIRRCTTHGQSKTVRYRMFLSAKRRAKKHSVPFNLDFSKFPEIPDKCPVLGIPLNKSPKGKIGPKFNSPTLDRIKPEMGYVEGNIQIISHRANTIKSDATVEEILKVADYVLNGAVVH